MGFHRALIAVGVAFCAHGCERHASAQSTRTSAHRIATRDAQVDAGRSDWSDVAAGVRVREARVTLPEDPSMSLAWVVVRVDVRTVRPAIVRAPRETLQDAVDDRNVLVAIDGGYFDPAHAPAGLVVVAGRTLAAQTSRGGSGILALRGGRAQVVPSADPFSVGADVDLAVQCGPRILESDGSIGIRRDDGQRFARTVACLRDGGATVDFIATWSHAEPIRGPGLLGLARALAAPSPVGDPRGCEAALNLDGGPSTAAFVRGPRGLRHDGVGPTPWLIEIRRSSTHR